MTQPDWQLDEGLLEYLRQRCRHICFNETDIKDVAKLKVNGLLSDDPLSSRHSSNALHKEYNALRVLYIFFLDTLHDARHKKKVFSVEEDDRDSTVSPINRFVIWNNDYIGFLETRCATNSYRCRRLTTSQLLTFRGLRMRYELHVEAQRIRDAIRVSMSEINEHLVTIRRIIGFRSRYPYFIDVAVIWTSIEALDIDEKRRMYVAPRKMAKRYLQERYAHEIPEGESPEFGDPDMSVEDSFEKRLADYQIIARGSLSTLEHTMVNMKCTSQRMQAATKHHYAYILDMTALCIICFEDGGGTIMRRLLNHAHEAFLACHRLVSRNDIKDTTWEYQVFMSMMRKWENYIFVLLRNRLDAGATVVDDIKEEQCRQALVHLLRTESSLLSGEVASNDDICLDCRNFTFPQITKLLVENLRIPIATVPEGVERFVVQGHYSHVFRVAQEELKDVPNAFAEIGDFAVKKILQKSKKYYFTEAQLSARIFRELLALSKIQHPNIVPVLGLALCFHSLTYPSVILPWIADGNMEEYLQVQNPGLSLRLSFMRDIASALAYLHDHWLRIAHNDLRANNVMIHNRTALLTDFGIASIYNARGLVPSQPSNVHWLAPEYIIGGTTSGTAYGDMYSYGCVFYEALTQQIPYYEFATSPGSLIICRREDISRIPSRHPRIVNNDHWEYMRHSWSADSSKRPAAYDAVDRMNTFLSTCT